MRQTSRKGIGQSDISQWMRAHATQFLLKEVEKNQLCDIAELQMHTQVAALKVWPQKMKTKHTAQLAKSFISQTSRSKHWLRKVRRELRDSHDIVTVFVSERYFLAEDHWDDDDYMFAHRHEFFPSKGYPAVAIVVQDLNRYAGSAARERLGRTGRGFNKQVHFVSRDAKARGVETDEAAAELGRSCGQAELVRAKMWNNKAFRKAFDIEIALG